MRDASSWAASFLVDADTAQAIVEPTGLDVVSVLPGKALVSIPVVQYRDTDLDAYNEVGIAFLVREHDAPRARGPLKALELVRGRIGIYIHHLPVDQEFTLAAGRELWGFPKFLAGIAIDDGEHETVCELRDGETLVLRLRFGGGPSIPFVRQSPPAYTFLNGVLRRTRWTTSGNVTARLGGAGLELGAHPIAEELRALGLPKRAFMTQVMPKMRAAFERASVVG